MDVQKIGVIGAGTMGSGIAQVCALAGREVTLFDAVPAAVEHGFATIRGSLARLSEKERISAADGQAALSRVHAANNFEELATVDVVIEAAPEDFGIKQDLFGRLDGLCHPKTILASNTSSLSLTQLAAATQRPMQVIGMHFFNPVPVMKLVEIVRALQTSQTTYETIATLATAIGKTPVAVSNSPGFVANRLLIPMINEAAFALQGKLANAADIDTVMKLGLNHPIGPLALADLIGLDVCLSVMKVLHQGFGDSKYRPCPLLQEMVAAGYLGRKTGRGFFDYAHA
jgi:3-hydroxybutyryl-CoA dehydrogenase